MFAAHDLGYRALVVNVSDVAAMAGSPRFGLVALGLPKDTEPAWVVELYGGLREAADEYAVALVGGDLSSASEVTISVTLTGEAPRGRAVTRSGASPGDRLVVTGRLGAAAGGLLVARQHHRDAGTNWGRELLAALSRPVARVGEGQTLAQFGATAMIDVSDGLALDLWRLCRESAVGATVRLGDLPAALELAHLVGVEPADLVLHGGEDFELLATLPPDTVDAATATLWERFGTRLSAIGEVVEGSALTAIGLDGEAGPLEPKGWDHFAAQ